MRVDIKKRGLSPVIASVLLILLVLVVAAMIFLWARTFLVDQTENPELTAGKLCSYVSFSAVLNDEGNILEIINRGDINISAVEIKMYSAGDSEVVKVDVNVSVGKSVRREVDLGDINSFDKIEILPVLNEVVNDKSLKKSFTCYDDSILSLDF